MSIQNSAHDPALAAVVRRVTRRLIPILLLMYVLAFLDRANLGFAKAAFQADTGLRRGVCAGRWHLLLGLRRV